MVENISLNMSVPFTPSAFPTENQKNNNSNSILIGTKVESKSSADSYASPDSGIFYTPDGSSNNSDLNAMSTPSLQNTVISDVVTNFKQVSPQNESLFSRNATEFICNLNPPNSSFQIGASNTQMGKVALLPTPNKDILGSNKISRVSVSPLIPAKYRRITPSDFTHGFKQEIIYTVHDSGTSINAYSTRKFCQTIDSNHRNKRPRTLDLPNETFHTPKSGLGSPTLRKKLFRPSNKKRKSFDLLIKKGGKKDFFACNSCSNTYTCKMKYDNHMTRHYNGLQLWNCEVCNRSFHTNIKYILHKQTHLDDKMVRRSGRNNALSNTILSPGIPSKLKHSLQKTYELKKSLSKIQNIPKFKTGVTPESCRKNKLKLEDSLLNFTTSTPAFSSTKSKHKFTRRMRKTESFQPASIPTPQSPDLPEIGFTEKTPNKIIKNSYDRKASTHFTCDQCPRAFSTMRALNIHKHMHKKLKANTSNLEITSKLICDQCGKVCGNMRALNRHRQLHEGLSIDNKSNCDETISLNSTRKLRKVSRRPSPCKLCDFECTLHVLQC